MIQDGEDQHGDGGDGYGFKNVDDEDEDDNDVFDTGFQCSGHLRTQAQWGVEPGCCLQRRYFCIFGW